MATIKAIDYSSRDYASLRADLIAAVPDFLPEWTQQTDSDFGVVMIELFSFVGDIMNYYIDRAANEMFLTTAVRRESVLHIARLVDYVPISMTPATVQLTFTLAGGSGTTVIPAGTKVATTPTGASAPVFFETDVALTILGSVSATPTYVGVVAATQGQTVTDEILTASSSGTIDQEYTLFNPNVIDASIEVEIDEGTGFVVWSAHQQLIDLGGGMRMFSSFLDENDVMHIKFGDNVNGRAPSSGSIIKATYRIGDGASGNSGANTIVELFTPISNVQSVTNVQASSGGSDSETVESMRTTIPKSLDALQRAVTLVDFEALTLKVPGVAKARAYALVYTSVLLYVAPVGGGMPSTALKNAVVINLDDKKLINVTVQTSNPVYKNVNISATVYVLPQFHQSTIKQNAENALRDLLVFTNSDFGKTTTISEVYHTIQGLDGVDYATITLLVRGDAATPAGVQDVAMDVMEIPQPGTISLTMSGGVV